MNQRFLKMLIISLLTLPLAAKDPSVNHSSSSNETSTSESSSQDHSDNNQNDSSRLTSEEQKEVADLCFQGLSEGHGFQ